MREIASYAERPAAIVSSDDAEAKRVVRAIANDLGFDDVDGGPLLTARFTEPAGMLWAQLAFEGGYGETVAFRLLRRE